MLRVDTDAVAIRRGAVTKDDAADAVARWGCEVTCLTTLEVDDRRHLLLPT